MTKDLLQEASVRLRSLARAPTFVAGTIGSIGLGVAGCTLAFAMVYNVFLRPPAISRPEDLVLLMETSSATCSSCIEGLSFKTYKTWRTAHAAAVAGISIYKDTSLELAGGERLHGASVSSNFFSVLGSRAKYGRILGAQDKDAPQVIVLSYILWERLGGSPALIGSVLHTKRGDKRVIGVMPAAFQVPREALYWIPVTTSDESSTPLSMHWAAIARLRAGVGAQAAATSLRLVSGRTNSGSPGDSTVPGVAALPLLANLKGSGANSVWLVFGAVLVLFVLSCTNVATLVFARAQAREPEVALRWVLGAGASRLAMISVIEGVLFVVLGGGVGLGFARVLARAVGAKLSTVIGSPVDLRFGAPVIAFASVLLLVSGLVGTGVPIALLSKVNPASALRGGVGGMTASRNATTLRGTLVVIQISAAVVLAYGAMLLMKSFRNVESVDLGVDAQTVVATHVGPLPDSAAEPRLQALQAREVVHRLDAVPGVSSAAAWGLSLIPWHFSGPHLREAPLVASGPSGTTLLPSHLDYPPFAVLATAGLFKTLGMEVIRGRTFTEADATGGGSPVAIVNQAMARRLWPDGNAVGRLVKLGPSTSNAPWLTVIGVVSNSVRLDPEEGLDMAVYHPHRDWPAVFVPLGHAHSFRRLIIAVRPKPSAHVLARDLVSAVRQVSPEDEIDAPEALINLFASTPHLTEISTVSTLFLGLSILGLVTALVGVYGIVHESVVRRTRELGIRMALGAGPRKLVFTVCRGAFRLAGAGLLIGFMVAWVLAHTEQAVLYGRHPQLMQLGLLVGVRVSDSLVIGAVGGMILLVVVIAAVQPSRRAMRVDPVESLRQE